MMVIIIIVIIPTVTVVGPGVAGSETANLLLASVFLLFGVPMSFLLFGSAIQVTGMSVNRFSFSISFLWFISIFIGRTKQTKPNEQTNRPTNQKLRNEMEWKKRVEATRKQELNPARFLWHILPFPSCVSLSIEAGRASTTSPLPFLSQISECCSQRIESSVETKTKTQSRRDERNRHSMKHTQPRKRGRQEEIRKQNQTENRGKEKSGGHFGSH